MKFVRFVLSAIKQEFNLYLSLQNNTIIRWSARFTVLLISTSLLILILSWNKLPAEVPLWYSKPWGADRLAAPGWLFLLPGAGFCWYIINSFLSLHVTKEHLVFSQILFLCSLLVSMFSIVTLTMIIWIIS